MKKKQTIFYLITGFTLLSLCIYTVQFLVFKKPQDTIFYLFQDLAFVPIQVLLATVFINRFINVMENRKKIKKINVIISAFFAQSGQAILCAMCNFDQHPIQKKGEDMEQLHKLKPVEMKKRIQKHDFCIEVEPNKLETLSFLLNENKDFLLGMLANPNLLEHDSFTDMLWAVFHVGDELKNREDLHHLALGDKEHLSNDIKRAYVAMLFEWTQYMNYLRVEYPFLYALAVKKNPFVATD